MKEEIFVGQISQSVSQWIYCKMDPEISTDIANYNAIQKVFLPGVFLETGYL